MKQIFLAIVFLTFAMYSATAQDSLHYKMTNPGIEQPVPGHTLKYSQEYYLEKSARCKKAAWIMLGGGTAMLVGGYIVAKNASTATDNTIDQAVSDVATVEAGAIVALIGGNLALGSIPLFITAHHYKKKAMSMNMSFKMQPYHELQQTGMTTKFTPGVSFKINF